MESSGRGNACDYSHNVTFFYDYVGKEISRHWRVRDCVVVVLGLTICLIMILSNIMVMAAILINRRFHFPIYFLLANMAAADLFAGLAYTNLVLNTGPWTIRLSKQQWFIRNALVDMSLTASVANLLAVAVERHQTIITMQLHSKMTKRRVVLLIVCIWAVSIIMGLVPSMGWNCECQLSDCSIIAPLYSRRYMIFWASLNLLTFSVMVAVYARIYVYVRRKGKRMSQHSSHQLRHNETVFNLMKTISIVLGVFVICWTPGLMTLLLDGIMGKDSHALTYEKYCLILAECNSLVNPIIYSFRDEEMRRTFKCILCCLCRRSSDHQGEQSPVEFNTLQPEVDNGCEVKSEKANFTALQLIKTEWRQASSP
ncbi:lysophosphatidic acid receptor 2a [Oncorhynchus mykiss]|uniref:Lysophosphatidic acid receptor 2a n=1 Tax=Oncorhynchus mykiss TaxID=8022 RepID=A0A8C7TL08_ONCMY|nr:lysophosphatidic acid receptor 2a [Oncorhynchus mykiss]XP_021480153.1 lysophosphatidic acid receptor 2a [Oncorhynchus mykiss]XP_021480154.1 lysophosphatidic acid receptor 2a [Oncorhynchus mykiss]XP_021480155.1 lysophosphatidic acid receptor 2a [Oncorhynchus mykiss]XP_021480156.1 lysophosphatidic acid receptor 2a [Oncorhynchus mykiss]